MVAQSEELFAGVPVSGPVMMMRGASAAVASAFGGASRSSKYMPKPVPPRYLRRIPSLGRGSLVMVPWSRSIRR